MRTIPPPPLSESDWRGWEANGRFEPERERLGRGDRSETTGWGRFARRQRKGEAVPGCDWT